MTSLRNQIDEAFSKKKQVLTIFSGNDLAPIYPLLVALRVDDSIWPGFSSSLVIELYEGSLCGLVSNRFFRILVNGKDQVPQGAEKQCNLDWGICPLHILETMLNSFISPDSYVNVSIG